MADYLDKAAAAVDAVKGKIIGEKAVESKNEAFQAAASGDVSKAAKIYVRSWSEELGYMGGKITDLGRGFLGTFASPISGKTAEPTENKSKNK